MEKEETMGPIFWRGFGGPLGMEVERGNLEVMENADHIEPMLQLFFALNL
jgi:hypothetical protein